MVTSFFLSAEELSVELLGRVVPEKRLYDACTSRSYQPKLFDRTTKKVTVEELKDKILHELNLSDMAEVEVVQFNYNAIIEYLSSSSLIVLDGKQDTGCALRYLCTADVDGYRLLVVLNSSFPETTDVAQQLFGRASLEFLLRISEAPKIDETSVLLEKLPQSVPVALFYSKDSNQPMNGGSLLQEMHRCNLCFSDVVMGAEFDELYKLVGSQDYVSVVAQLSPENDFLLDSVLRNMRGFKKIVLLVTSVEHKARVENKVDERRRGSDI